MNEQRNKKLDTLHPAGPKPFLRFRFDRHLLKEKPSFLNCQKKAKGVMLTEQRECSILKIAVYLQSTDLSSVDSFIDPTSIPR